jgi:hypothetical protein
MTCSASQVPGPSVFVHVEADVSQMILMTGNSSQLIVSTSIERSSNYLFFEETDQESISDESRPKGRAGVVFRTLCDVQLQSRIPTFLTVSVGIETFVVEPNTFLLLVINPSASLLPLF